MPKKPRAHATDRSVALGRKAAAYLACMIGAAVVVIVMFSGLVYTKSF